MGKTPKPLKFLLLDPEMAEWEEFKHLAGQGHIVDSLGGEGPRPDVEDYDVILGPKAWYFTRDSRPFFQLMLKQVRGRVYESPSEKANDNR